MANEHILIIDDKIEIISLLVDLLRPLGYVLSFATHGELGLQKALSEQPDLILLDLHMPGKSGLEVLQTLRQRNSRSAVILMTLYGSEGVVVEAFRLGVRDYVNKPFDLPELLSAVERALEEGRLRRQRERLLVELGRMNQELTGLYDRSRRQAQQLATINRVAQTVVSSLDLKQVMSIVVASIKEALHVETATLALLDEACGELVLEVRLEAGGGESSPVRLKVGQGIMGYVIQTGQPVIVNDVTGDSRFHAEADRAAGPHDKSILCAPLTVPGKVVGAIEAINKLDEEAADGLGQFNERDQELLLGAAAFVAMAVENARLHQAMHDAVAKQTVNEIVVTLSHYVRNPLQVLMGLAEMTRRLHDLAEVAAIAERVEYEVKRIGTVMSVLCEIGSPGSTAYLDSIRMWDIEQELQAKLAAIQAAPAAD